MQTMGSNTLVAWTEKDGFSYSALPGLAGLANAGYLPLLKMNGGARACPRSRNASLFPGAAGRAWTCRQGSRCRFYSLLFL